jgi:transposase
MANRMRSEVKERQWRRHVSSWQGSGVTIRQYCLQHHLSEPSFYAWRRELARRDEAADAPAPPVPRNQAASITWMPVTVTASAAPVVEVQLPSGTVLRVPAGVESITLERILTMISLRLPARVFLCLTPTDMRKSFDGLAALVQSTMAADPLAGDLFVFRGKRGDRIKLLYFDGDGYALWYKRLEQGTFVFPSVSATQGQAGYAIRAADLVMLLDGVDLSSVQRLKRYQRPASAAAASA